MSLRCAIEYYILAKDHNRPHLMREAFAESARLEMVVNTDAISFPPVVNGLAAISQTLVQRFGQTYENVYTFCLSPPPAPNVTRWTCKWLVGMSEKSSGLLRVGCGRYDWLCEDPSSPLVSHLKISIEHMVILPAVKELQAMTWLSSVSPLWCDPAAAFDLMPDWPELKPIADFGLRIA